MFTRPTTFNFGNVFSYSGCVDNIQCNRPQFLTLWATDSYLDQENVTVLEEKAYFPCCVKARNDGYDTSITDLSQRKIVWVQDLGNNKVKVEDTFFAGSHQEIWVPLYRPKQGCESTSISMTCTAVTAGGVIPFGLVYNALRIAAIPFLLLYHIGRCVYDILKKDPHDVRTNKEIVWDHTIEWLDEALSHVAQLFDTLFWRLASIGGHIVGIFEGLCVNVDHRIGRKIVAWCECMANREISLLKKYKRKQPEGPDLAKGQSLFYGFWSVQGYMDKFKIFSSYHAFFLAGCFQPVGIGILNEDSLKARVISVRSDSGRMIGNTCNKKDDDQVKFRVCCC